MYSLAQGLTNFLTTVLDNKHFRLFRPRGNIRDMWVQGGENSPKFF